MSEKRVQRMCRSCTAHLGGAVAGTHVRWELCMSCDLDPFHDLPWWRWLRVRWNRRQQAKALAENPVSATYPEQGAVEGAA